MYENWERDAKRGMYTYTMRISWLRNVIRNKDNDWIKPYLFLRWQAIRNLNVFERDKLTISK